MSQDILINGQRLQAAQLHRNIATAVGNEALSGVAASQANNRAKNLQENVSDLNEKVENLELEVEFYKKLLAQPMHVIAHNNNDFKKAYDLQQELLANWMVSQKAFKELAIDLGLQLGRSKEDVVQAGFENKSKVLNNKTKHNNNAEDSTIIQPHIEKLKKNL